MSTLRVTGLKQETSTATNISLAVGGGVTVAGVSTFHNAVTASSGITITTQDTSVTPLSIATRGGGTNGGHLEGEGPKINFLATRSADGANGSAAYIQQKAIGDLGSSYPVDLAFGVRRFGSSFEAMRIASTGYVGIGTDIPAGQFQVGQSGGSNVIITPNIGVDINDGAINLYQATSNANAVPFLISSDVGGTETEKLRVTAGGYVGIGTDNPSSELHVQNSSGNCGLRVISSATGVSYLNLGDTGDNNAGSIEYSNNENYLLIKTADNERFRIDSSGRTLLGGATVARGVADATPARLQVDTVNYCVFAGVQNSNNNAGAILSLGKSRGIGAGTSVAVTDNDFLGSVVFGGADGTDVVTEGARISSQVDGTVASNNVPGDLSFWTANGGTSYQWLTLSSGGALRLGLGVEPLARFTVASNGSNYAVEEYTGVSANGGGNRDYYATAHARGRNVTRGTSEFTIDIGTPANANGNQAFFIKCKILAVAAVANQAAEIEFYANARASGGTYTYWTTTPVRTNAILGTSINAGSIAWSGAGNLKTLQYTSSSISYVKFKFDVEVVGHDYSTFVLAGN